MNTEKYIVRLSDEERQELETIVKKLKGTSQKVNRALALLHADANGPDWTNEQIASRTGLTLRAISNIRKQLVTEGFEVTLLRVVAKRLPSLNRKQRRLPPVPQKLDGLQEAQVIATRCGSPPEAPLQKILREVVASIACQSNGGCGKPHRITGKSSIRSAMKQYARR